MFDKKKFCLLLAFGATLVSCQLRDASGSSYNGYAVIRCLPESIVHLTQLKKLAAKQTEANIQFWTEPRALNSSVDILVNPEAKVSVQQQLNDWDIPARELIKDVGDEINKTKASNFDIYSDYMNREMNETSRAKWRSIAQFYTKFQRYDAIIGWLNQLPQNDQRVSVETIGYSFEKRPIPMVKISTNAQANKPVIFIDGGHHAREWISISTALYIMDSLLSEETPRMSHGKCKTETCSRATREMVKLDLDKYDYWFVPVVNPDGYEYTHTTDRLWRKTRSRRSYCEGVDPNRNYPFHWMEAGASSFSCSQTFGGPAPLSEPETRALAQVLDSNKARIVMYISLHCYSQLILAPYGYGRVYPDNYAQLERVAGQWIAETSKLRGMDYQFGTSAIILYPAAGGSDDYAHGQANIKLAYTIELPDKGEKGFVMPPSEIVPVGQETVIGLKAMIDAIEA